MTKQEISPAAVSAFLSGDIDNAIVAITPGGIEAQEAQGQRDLIHSLRFPIKINSPHDTSRVTLEAMGIVFGEQVDNLFVSVQLPAGWEKVPTEHSMWSKLMDDQGRERASIFYKAAFYDRDAFINILCRFRYGVYPVCGFDTYYNEDRPHVLWRAIVWDYVGTVWEHPERLSPRPEAGSDREVYWAWDRQKRQLRDEVEAWLAENYPEYENPIAYWNDAEIMHMDTVQP